MNLKNYAGGDPPYVSLDGFLNWEHTILPPVSEVVCMLQKLHMGTVSTDELNPEDDDSLTAYRAKINFFLLKANKVISLTLTPTSSLPRHRAMEHMRLAQVMSACAFGLSAECPGSARGGVGRDHGNQCNGRRRTSSCKNAVLGEVEQCCGFE